MKTLEAYAVVRTAIKNIKAGKPVDIEKIEEALGVMKVLLARYVRVQTSINREKRRLDNKE